MKKIVNILFASLFPFCLQNCSIDDQQVIEERPEFNNKTGNSINETIPNSCQIIYTFNEPNLTNAQKAAIRSGYPFTIYSYSPYNIIQEIGEEDIEVWIVGCYEYNLYNTINPGCDTHGCYIETPSCPRAGCASTPPKDPDPEDPFDNPDEVPN